MDTWIEASIIAHNFIEVSYWFSKMSEMRGVYIPNLETCLYENKDGNVVFSHWKIYLYRSYYGKELNFDTMW